jgi:hypothetical protein
MRLRSFYIKFLASKVVDVRAVSVPGEDDFKGSVFGSSNVATLQAISEDGFPKDGGFSSKLRIVPADESITRTDVGD